MLQDKEYIIIGHLGSPYGVKGWLKVNTDSKENILKYLPWQLYLNHHWTIAPIKASRWVGKHPVIQLEDCHTPEEARRYNGVKIGIHANQLPPLPKGEYYWSQLIGLNVITREGISLGIIDHLLETGANDVLVVIGEKTHLIPYLPHRVIQEINLVDKQMFVDWDPE